MRLDVPCRPIGPADLAPLVAFARRLAPLYEGPDAPVWSTVAERSKWIGREDRPADIAFRKMNPSKYVQLCVVNDESPWSPWALPIPEAVVPRADQEAFARDQEHALRALFGEGALFFLVFAVLGPGGVIPTHRDMPHDVNKKAFSHHLHVAITGADDCELTFKDAPQHFEPGVYYEVDNMDPHSVVNRGDGYRVNLMIDYCPAASLADRAAPSPVSCPTGTRPPRPTPR